MGRQSGKHIQQICPIHGDTWLINCLDGQQVLPYMTSGSQQLLTYRSLLTAAPSFCPVTAMAAGRSAGFTSKVPGPGDGRWPQHQVQLTLTAQHTPSLTKHTASTMKHPHYLVPPKCVSEQQLRLLGSSNGASLAGVCLQPKHTSKTMSALVTHPMTPAADLPYAKAYPTDNHTSAASITSRRFFNNMWRTFFALPLPVSIARNPTCIKNTRNLQRDNQHDCTLIGGGSRWWWR